MKAPRSIPPAEAYDLWAASYDAQPENLMLKLDAGIFSRFLSGMDLKEKIIVDVGCGTGRHWEEILAGQPKRLIGFDVSREMLDKLRSKFPGAETYLDEKLTPIAERSCDLIISTLTVAHIENLYESLDEWIRKLKPASEVIITDFHPDALVKGGKRTFTHNGRQVSITNYTHDIGDIKQIFHTAGFYVTAEETRIVDESLKKYYAHQNALHVYERFYGVPIIFGLHLKRAHDSA